MDKVTEIKKIEETRTTDEDILTLTKTYNFEGEQISKIDFSGMENITANDMIKANRVMAASGSVSTFPEGDLHYALIIAASATGYPVEFFKTLKPKDAIRVKNKVTSFFYGVE